MSLALNSQSRAVVIHGASQETKAATRRGCHLSPRIPTYLSPLSLASVEKEHPRAVIPSDRLQAAKGCSKIQLSSEEDPLNWLYNTKWSRDVQETLSIGVREQKEMG